MIFYECLWLVMIAALIAALYTRDFWSCISIFLAIIIIHKGRAIELMLGTRHLFPTITDNEEKIARTILKIVVLAAVVITVMIEVWWNLQGGKQGG